MDKRKHRRTDSDDKSACKSFKKYRTDISPFTTLYIGPVLDVDMTTCIKDTVYSPTADDVSQGINIDCIDFGDEDPDSIDSGDEDTDLLIPGMRIQILLKATSCDKVSDSIRSLKPKVSTLSGYLDICVSNKN